MSRKNTTWSRIAASASMFVLGLGLTSATHADPLPGEVIKFSQQPINNLPIGGAIYQGHDEVSTAYQYINSQGLQSWQGGSMVDDFADNFSTPIVHLKWWGSYMNNNYVGAGVQQFLVAIEQDVPVGPGNTFSHPGAVLSTQILNAGTLSPGSGTFDEKLINANAPEHLYQYNGELAVPFAEQADTVYWLKIVALTNDAQLSWGWHDRDYTQQDLLASPNVTPGEGIIGFVGPAATPSPVWHFQDDAVRSAVDIQPLAPSGYAVTQPLASMGPTTYIDNIDGPNPIGNFSKDLAFELYTQPVPEPASLSVVSLGALQLLRRKR